MITFFRKIRKKLADDNKPLKYLRYAIGEIVLVVIGILIALQINNTNEDRIQTEELDGLMKSISSAIQSDINYLRLLRTARESIGIKADSIFDAYINAQNPALVFEDYAFVANTFNELTNLIYYQPNLSAFEALKNSIYLSKLQGTDIELLLNSFYTSAERLQKQEESYNQSMKTDYQTWSNTFRNKGIEVFMTPWEFMGEGDIKERFLEVLNAQDTKALFAKSFVELNMTGLYDQQILLGEKYIEMVDKQEMNFDEQTKIEFSGILYSYSEVGILNLLVNGKVPSDFGLLYAQSSNKFYSGIKFKEDHIVLTYPDNTLAWGSPYFNIRALNGRVTEMDFSKFDKVILEMRGAEGGEAFALMMKDKYDLPDGTESRVDITLTDTWKTYEVSIDQFETADKKIIQTPLGFVFLGGEGRTIQVRSIQFK
ncbi:MAG: hypothetical protein E4H26_01075 [Flavobacteriales bacterium]|nr:MAG: hypothetical protein E4H26_01075 [Flavobacteriales bacterium]